MDLYKYKLILKPGFLPSFCHMMFLEDWHYQSRGSIFWAKFVICSFVSWFMTSIQKGFVIGRSPTFLSYRSHCIWLEKIFVTNAFRFTFSNSASLLRKFLPKCLVLSILIPVIFECLFPLENSSDGGHAYCVLLILDQTG